MCRSNPAGVHKRIRTSDPTLRRRVLYPTELCGHLSKSLIVSSVKISKEIPYLTFLNSQNINFIALVFYPSDNGLSTIIEKRIYSERIFYIRTAITKNLSPLGLYFFSLDVDNTI
mgnify:CR=1 FL=1